MRINIKLVKTTYSIPFTTDGTLCTVFHANVAEVTLQKQL